MRFGFPFTAVPKAVFRDLVRELPSIELKSLLIVIDHSLGFSRRRTPPLRVHTLAQATGLCSRSVQRALHGLEERGLIRRHPEIGQASSFELTLSGIELSEGSDPTPTLPPPASGGGRLQDPGGGDSRVAGHVIGVRKKVDRKSSYPNPQEDFSSSWQDKAPPIPAPEGAGIEERAQPPREAKDSGTPEAPHAKPVAEETSDLMPIAEAVAQKLEGATLRLVTPADILPTLRALRAECLNRNLNLDLKQLVLDKVEKGVEANARKNGGVSSIHGWSYFVKGLPDALELKVREVERQTRIQAMRVSRVEEESAQEREQEERVGRLRSQWEQLDLEERTRIEKGVLSQLPGFMLQLVRRDHEQGKRGSGIVALEQACLQELSRRTQLGSAFHESSKNSINGINHLNDVHSINSSNDVNRLLGAIT